MKRFISIILIMVLMLSIAGCAGKRSGLTIDALQQVLRESDSDLVLQKTQTETGYSFQYKDNSTVLNIAYSGEADAKRNVQSIKIVNYDVPVSSIRNTEKLNQILSKSESQITMNDLRVMYCYIAVLNLCEAFEGKDCTLSVQDFVNLFPGYSITKGNWTIKGQIEGSSTVVISATYSA